MKRIQIELGIWTLHCEPCVHFCIHNSEESLGNIGAGLKYPPLPGDLAVTKGTRVVIDGEEGQQIAPLSPVTRANLTKPEAQ